MILFYTGHSTTFRLTGVFGKQGKYILINISSLYMHFEKNIVPDYIFCDFSFIYFVIFYLKFYRNVLHSLSLTWKLHHSNVFITFKYRDATYMTTSFFLNFETCYNIHQCYSFVEFFHDNINKTFTDFFTDSLPDSTLFTYLDTYLV